MINILEVFKKVSINEGVTITKLEQIIGASKGVLSRAITNNTDIQSKWLLSLVENYPHYNSEWLLTGKGPMLKQSNAGIQLINNGRKTQDAIQITQEIPLYSLEAAASVVALFNDYSSFEPIDTLKIPNLSKCDGAIYVTGDSMYPLLKSGDIVAFKEVPSIASSIYYGEMYIVSVIIEDDYYTVIKFVQKSEKGEEYVKLVSQNKHHQDKDIPIADIKALAIVKASVRLNTM
jgi:phage repressor protein C with HTH and peptisase S24 domain